MRSSDIIYIYNYYILIISWILNVIIMVMQIPNEDRTLTRPNGMELISGESTLEELSYYMMLYMSKRNFKEVQCVDQIRSIYFQMDTL